MGDAGQGWARWGLPPEVAGWFARRGWTPHPHQLALLDVPSGGSALLVAPTGGGKTLAGFLPTLCELRGDPPAGLHTLYISPLKALAADVGRNLQAPVEGMGLKIRCELRTGDTPAARRARQRKQPPQILLTTPESLAVLNASADAPVFFGGLRRVVVDELHALADGKRGDLLALNLARLRSLAPRVAVTALTATVAEPGELARWLDPERPGEVRVVRAAAGAGAEVSLLRTRVAAPWAGHSGLHAVPELVELIREHRMTLIFVNTRAQAELLYRGLVDATAGEWPLVLHHGSLAAAVRREAEAVMAAGECRAVVATSSLDLGIDWGAVDLVVQVGAPRQVARLVQRIGRSNHRLDRPSRAVLVPLNRMEQVEAMAAREAVAAGALDNRFGRVGALDVLAQHVVSVCCGEPVTAEELYREVRRAGPYAGLERGVFDRVVGFACEGGYALRRYEQFRKLEEWPDGRLAPVSPRVVRQHRMGIGTIVGDPVVGVRMRNRRRLGEIEERFIQGLRPGQKFLFGGRVVRLVGMREGEAVVAPATGPAEVPSYAGGRMALSPDLSARVRAWLADPGRWGELPEETAQWLEWQRRRSVLPPAEGLLVESFPRGGREVLAVHGFAGRNAHQTLGLLLTQRMEREGLGPMGFAANDYGVAVWSVRAVEEEGAVARLLDGEVMARELEEWMAATSVLVRAFRECALVAGMIERPRVERGPGRRGLAFSAQMIFEVLRRHEPGHVVLEAARVEAARGLADSVRLEQVLREAAGRMRFVRLGRVSPLAIPLLLEVGREGVEGEGKGMLLAEAARLVAEAAGE